MVSPPAEYGPQGGDILRRLVRSALTAKAGEQNAPLITIAPVCVAGSQATEDRSASIRSLS